MTRHNQSQRELVLLIPLLTPNDTGRIAQIAAEMRNYSLTILGLSETLWSQTGKVKLSSREVLLYSGHNRENAPHMEGVGIMISTTAARSLIDWKPVSSRIITARFYTKVQKVTVVQCCAPTNDAVRKLRTPSTTLSSRS